MPLLKLSTRTSPSLACSVRTGWQVHLEVFTQEDPVPLWRKSLKKIDGNFGAPPPPGGQEHCSSARRLAAVQRHAALQQHTRSSTGF